MCITIELIKNEIYWKSFLFVINIVITHNLTKNNRNVFKEFDNCGEIIENKI